jgi:HK97 gp10 family phage protein
MAGAITIRVEGAREIEAALKELGVRASNRVLRSALMRAGTVLQRAARENAPQPGSADDPFATGALRKAITKRLRRARPGKQELLVGIERPRSRIAHLVEFGTSRMAAEPYLRPALDEQGHEAVEVLRQAMVVGIAREVEKLRVKARGK